MKTNNHELTDLEISMIKLMGDNSGNDCYFNISESEQDIGGWFGWFDEDFKAAASAEGINGKTISGVAGSLAKKGIISVYLSEYGEPNMKTGKHKMVKAFQIRASAVDEVNEFLKNNEV
jgi:hypothetical protein